MRFETDSSRQAYGLQTRGLRIIPLTAARLTILQLIFADGARRLIISSVLSLLPDSIERFLWTTW
jgi:hypothetical protein